MKRYILIFVCFMSVASCWGKDVVQADSLNDINAIKRDTSYIYAESTMRDVIEAQSGARSILELKVTDWIRTHYPNELLDTCLAKVSEYWKTLVSKRGKYNRVLVFIKKDQIVSMPVNNDELISSKQTDEIVPVTDAKESPWTAVEETMASVSSFKDIEPFVVKLKEEGRLHAYGKYASLPEEAVCHIFVYNKGGAVVAVLRQSEDGTYNNLRTNESDNIKNYKNCGAIWLQLK